MRSLRSRLLALWLLSLVASGAVGLMLVGLYRQSTGAQLDHAAEAVAASCGMIAERFAYFAAGWAGPVAVDGAEGVALRAELAAVVAFALAGRPGLSGGFWQPDTGVLAASMPLDPALRAVVADLAHDVGDNDRAAGARIAEIGGTLLVEACTVTGPIPGLVAFATAQSGAAPGQDRLRYGLGGLFVLVGGVTLLLGWATVAWSRRVRRIEAGLAAQEAGGLPQLAMTGERDLDRIVAALNRARAHGDALAARVAQAERFSALGRVAAGVAHEVRNPVAAMRLRAENGLAGDDARRVAALEAILGQIARLERLTGELLTMTQGRVPALAPVDIAAFLDAIAADHGGIVRVQALPATGLLDAALLRRALDELIQNARRVSDSVTLRATLAGDFLRIEVADRGPGVPESLRKNLFEPFVTGRPEGTGLGLAITREIMEAMGGRILLADPGPHAVFALEVPWRAC